MNILNGAVGFNNSSLGQDSITTFWASDSSSFKIPD
jgi:hypothetical protein